jgi:hypothetical protein
VEKIEKLKTNQFNQSMLISMLVVATWFWKRADVFGPPSGPSVAIEWLCIFALLYLVLSLRNLNIHVPSTVISAALIVTVQISIDDLQSLQDFPDLWSGFGRQVMILSTLILTATWLVHAVSEKNKSSNREPKLKPFFVVRTSISLIAILWVVPTLLQTPDAWLNIGDSTEKVLDEIAGWANGNVPGVHTSWTAGSMLGLPLAPLSLIYGFPRFEILVIAVYTNGLVMMVPITMALTIRKMMRTITFVEAFAISLIAVCVSGPRINTAIFQELSFLGRGLFPLILGLLIVHFCTTIKKIGVAHIFAMGAVIALTALNNIEYGVGAAFSAYVVAAISLNARSFGIKQHVIFVASIVFTLIIATIPGLILGGDWLGRRIGTFEDVFQGDVTSQTYNNLGPIPPFGIFTIVSALAIASLVISLPRMVKKPGANPQIVGSAYVGMWVIGTLPYFLNGGGSGAFRSQFYLIPFLLLIFSNLDCGKRREKSINQSKVELMKDANSKFQSLSLSRAPQFLLVAVLVASIIQVPNGITEWKRVIFANESERNLDTWSMTKLDWISPKEVVRLSTNFGGPENVGWWFLHGNAVEIATKVENLTGHTGFETMRSKNQLIHGCESLMRSSKQYVITGVQSLGIMKECPGITVKDLGYRQIDGLTIVAISRRGRD